MQLKEILRQSDVNNLIKLKKSIYGAQYNYGRTSEDHGHTHKFRINDKGTGKTVDTKGEGSRDHVHMVVEFKVEEAGKDDHTHTIKKKGVKR